MKKNKPLKLSYFNIICLFHLLFPFFFKLFMCVWLDVAVYNITSRDRKKRKNKESWICRVGQNAVWWVSLRVNKHILHLFFSKLANKALRSFFLFFIFSPFPGSVSCYCFPFSPKVLNQSTLYKYM